MSDPWEDRKPEPDERLIARDPWWLQLSVLGAIAVIILVVLLATGVIR